MLLCHCTGLATRQNSRHDSTLLVMLAIFISFAAVPQCRAKIHKLAVTMHDFVVIQVDCA